MKAARRCTREGAPSPSRCVQLSQCATSANCVCVLWCACVLCRVLFFCFLLLFCTFCCVNCFVYMCLVRQGRLRCVLCPKLSKSPDDSGSRRPLIHGSSEVQRPSRAIVQNTMHEGACMLSCVVYGMAGQTYDIHDACDASMKNIFLVYETALNQGTS
jgi:hypothetical protein